MPLRIWSACSVTNIYYIFYNVSLNPLSCLSAKFCNSIFDHSSITWSSATLHLLFIDSFSPQIKYEQTHLLSIYGLTMALRSLKNLSKFYFELGINVRPSRFLSNAIENFFSLITAVVKSQLLYNLWVLFEK